MFTMNCEERRGLGYFNPRDNPVKEYIQEHVLTEAVAKGEEKVV